METIGQTTMCVQLALNKNLIGLNKAVDKPKYCVSGKINKLFKFPKREKFHVE